MSDTWTCKRCGHLNSERAEFERRARGLPHRGVLDSPDQNARIKAVNKLFSALQDAASQAINTCASCGAIRRSLKEREYTNSRVSPATFSTLDVAGRGRTIKEKLKIVAIVLLLLLIGLLIFMKMGKIL